MDVSEGPEIAANPTLRPLADLGSPLSITLQGKRPVEPAEADTGSQGPVDPPDGVQRPDTSPQQPSHEEKLLAAGFRLTVDLAWERR